MIDAPGRILYAGAEFDGPGSDSRADNTRTYKKETVGLKCKSVSTTIHLVIHRITQIKFKIVANTLPAAVYIHYNPMFA